MRAGRLGLSLGAVALALALCIHQKHFTVSLAHPMSFVLMLRHKCGMVMAGAVVWAVVEVVGMTRRLVLGWVAGEARGLPSVFGFDGTAGPTHRKVRNEWGTNGSAETTSQS